MVVTYLDKETVEGWNDEGMPGIATFSNAVSVWVTLQESDVVTVDQAASAFNVEPDIIREAVEYHYWMFLSGDVIEHDGE